jgi:biopolymer transport protein ExbD
VRRRTEEEPTINLTPMIDVVFLLLIFFMAGSSFHKADSQIPVSITGAGSLAPVARGVDPKILEINQQGQLALDRRPMSLQQAAAELSQTVRSFPNLEVLVRAEGNVTVAQQKSVLQMARNAGVRNIRL